MLSRLYCALIVLTMGGWLAPGHALAQSTLATPSRGIFGSLGFFHIGYATLNAGPALGPALAAELPELPGGGVSLGGGGYGIFHRVVIGGSGGRLRLADRVGETFAAHLEARGSQFEMGYAWQRGRLLVVPLLGIGSQEYTARLTNIRDQPTSFADVVTNPGRETRLTQKATIGSVALLGCGRFGGLLLGVRVQVSSGLRATSWRYNDQPLTGSPTWRPRRLSVSLLLGGGFFRQ